MIKYYCNTCKIELDTSECSVCNSRTEIKSKIYWCDECNIPIYDEECSLCGNKGHYVTTDLRPVFPEERLMFEVLLNEPFKFASDSVWNGAGNRYYVNGKPFKVPISDLMKKNPKDVIVELKENENKNKSTYEIFNGYIEKFVKANSNRYNFIVSEATNFIIDQKKDYGDDETFVSFSGVLL